MPVRVRAGQYAVDALIDQSPDKAIRERIEARNSLENYVFTLKNQVNDGDGLGSKITVNDEQTVSPSSPIRAFIGWTA
jgi:hypothetical protein